MTSDLGYRGQFPSKACCLIPDSPLDVSPCKFPQTQTKRAAEQRQTWPPAWQLGTSTARLWLGRPSWDQRNLFWTVSTCYLVTPTIIRPDTTSPRCSVIRYRLASRLGRVPPSDVCCRQYFYDNRDFIARRRGEEEKGSGKERVRCRICYYDGNKIGLLNRAQCGAAQLFTRFPRETG